MMILLKSSRNVVKDEPMSFEEKWAKQGRRKPKRNSDKVETKGERKKERKKR